MESYRKGPFFTTMILVLQLFLSSHALTDSSTETKSSSDQTKNVEPVQETQLITLQDNDVIVRKQNEVLDSIEHLLLAISEKYAADFQAESERKTFEDLQREREIKSAENAVLVEVIALIITTLSVVGLIVTILQTRKTIRSNRAYICYLETEGQYNNDNPEKPRMGIYLKWVNSGSTPALNVKVGMMPPKFINIDLNNFLAHDFYPELSDSLAVIGNGKELCAPLYLHNKDEIAKFIEGKLSIIVYVGIEYLDIHGRRYMHEFTCGIQIRFDTTATWELLKAQENVQETPMIDLIVKMIGPQNGEWQNQVEQFVKEKINNDV